MAQESGDIGANVDLVVRQGCAFNQTVNVSQNLTGCVVKARATRGIPSIPDVVFTCTVLASDPVLGSSFSMVLPEAVTAGMTSVPPAWAYDCISVSGAGATTPLLWGDLKVKKAIAV